MQQPTCSNIRIRSTLDAHRIFYAVQNGLLHMVTRRLDANERLALTTGCVYAWEERGSHSEVTGLGIERFTEGRRWSPSRVRDEFLFYYEKYTPPAGATLGSPTDANPPRNWDPLVKQTYSVWVETSKGRRKWHLTAYFTHATVDDLGTIDDIPVIKDLVIPPEMFQGTRIQRSHSKCEERSTHPSEQPSQPTAVSRTYAPFLSLYNRYPSELESAPSQSDSVLMYQPYQNSTSSPSPQDSVMMSSTEGHGEVFLHPVQAAPQYPHSNPRPAALFSPSTQDQNTSHVKPYSRPITSANTLMPSISGALPSAFSAPMDFCNNHPRTSASPSPPSLYDKPSAESSTSRASPLYINYEPKSYSFPSVNPVAEPLSDEGSLSNSFDFASAPDAISISRDGAHQMLSLPPMPEPSYELHSHQAIIPTERRGSTGPDRDLASIHSLTRRHPYRRDPLDDKALRRLPP